MRFFGPNTVRDGDCTTRTDADDKIDDLTEYRLSRVRCKKFKPDMNVNDKSSSASINSSS